MNYYVISAIFALFLVSAIFIVLPRRPSKVAAWVCIALVVIMVFYILYSAMVESASPDSDMIINTAMILDKIVVDNPLFV